MSEIKLISPMLDDFVIGEPYSDHHGVRCLPAMKNNSDTRYIVKVISIPASQVQVQAFLLTGVYKNEQEAKNYFHELATGVENEVAILSRLSKLEGFLAYEACQVVEMDNEIGYDIYLLGTYKRSLERHFRKYPMTHLAAVNLGLDMCASLAVCRQSGYICVDLKPGNIFISDDNEYRIGDLGFLSLNNLKYATLPDRYRSSYTAPEMVDPFANLNNTADIYAVGLILYQAYNGGTLPFEGFAPNDNLQPPLYADYEMSEIILKACAVDPADRWEDPIKMGQAIVSYMQRNGANDTPIVPPPPPAEPEVSVEPVPFEEEPADDSVEMIYDQADEAGQMIIEEMIDFDAAMQPDDRTSDAPQTDEIATSDDHPGEESADDQDDIGNLSFMDDMVNDETAPQEEMADDITYGELSEDANDILAQVDDLIAHETPAPAVAPEPIDVPFPPAVSEETLVDETDVPSPASVDTSDEEKEDQIPVEADMQYENEDIDLPSDDANTPPQAADTEEKQDPVDQTVAAISQAVEDSDSSLDTQITSDIELPAEVPAEQPEKSEDTPVPPTPDLADEPDFDAEEAPKKNIGTTILTIVLIAIIVGCIAVAGFLFYRDYYIKTVDSLTVIGEGNQLTVTVDSDADPSLISVICTDKYGNKQIVPLIGDSAIFTDLTPSSLYKISLEISGFHGLKGETKTSFTTPPQTEIVSFNSVTGAEAGTVILSFTVKGQHDVESWVVRYSAPGEQEKTQEFSGHTTTLTGLTVGNTYTITLDTADENDIFVVGQNKIEYTASELIYPTDLQVNSLSADGLFISWKEPEGVSVSGWTVHCYNDEGFNQTTTTADTTAEFVDIDPNAPYNIEVTANGMSVGDFVHISPNAVTVTDPSYEIDGRLLNISWSFTGNTPSVGWIVSYTIDDDPTEYTGVVDGTTAIIENIIPNTTYTIKFRLEGGITVLKDSFQVQIPEAKKFEGYAVTADNIKLTMCVPPANEDWIWWSILKYTDTFAVGEKAGFVMRLYKVYGTSPDTIHTLFVIRNSEGKIVSFGTESNSWTNMWFQFYGELTIPNMPQEPGEYTIEVYFNSAFVHSQSFTIE